MLERSLSDSEKKALTAFIEQNKKRIQDGMAKWYMKMDFMSDSAKPGELVQILTLMPNSYQYVGRLKIILYALINGIWDAKKLSYINGPKLEYVYKKVWKSFYKNYVKVGGKVSGMNNTTVIKELIARGFIHNGDAIDYRGRKYIIECTIAPLVWPEAFNTLEEAKNTNKGVGIPKYTNCPNLKNI